MRIGKIKKTGSINGDKECVIRTIEAAKDKRRHGRKEER